MASKSSWVVFGLAGVMAVGSVVTYLAKDDQPAAPAAASSSTSTSSTPPAAPTSAVAVTNPVSEPPANGCLGGVDAGKGLFAAQDQAPLTPQGAAAFAMTYIRWATQYPVTLPVTAVGPRIWTKDVSLKVRSGGDWSKAPKGATAFASMIDGYTLVESFTDDMAVVSVYYRQTLSDPQHTPQITENTSTMYLRAVNGKWRISDSRGLRQPEEVAAKGTIIKNGC